jgi:hypothetical protein
LKGRRKPPRTRRSAKESANCIITPAPILIDPVSISTLALA